MDASFKIFRSGVVEDLRSSGILRCVIGYSDPDVSGEA
jgi:hypothetical protein